MIDAQIENYRIIEKIGDGGMGSVYKAVDVMLEREVALKFLRPELAQQKDLVDRFRAEAIILAKLSHQNIASLYGLHRHGDDLFMAMEYVPGDTLEAMLARDRTLPMERAVAIAADVLQGLDYAHRRGVVHRDVKTANIIVPPSGPVKVMDFGIARVLGTERRTRVGFVVGTIGYMAPEQIQGLEVDGRTDIYALGVVLYEMLTGRLPFQGDTEYAVMQAQIQQMPVPPRTFAPVPVPVENTILRALAKLPHERFQTATEFNVALQASVRQSAMYPAATAPFSASGDETREFKSDPQLLAYPMPSSGVVPVFPSPSDSAAHAVPPVPPLPETQPFSVASQGIAPPAAGSGERLPLSATQPALTPPPVPSTETARRPLPRTDPAIPVMPPGVEAGAAPVTAPGPPPAVPLRPGASSADVPTSPTGGAAVEPAVPPEDEFDPDATIVIRGKSRRGAPHPAESGGRAAWDRPTVMTPIPGPPPSPPALVVPPPLLPEQEPETATPGPRPPTAATGTGAAAPPPLPLVTSDAPSTPFAPLTAAGPVVTPARTATVQPPVPPSVAVAARAASAKPKATPALPPAGSAKKGGATGLVIAAAAVIVLGALGALGFVVWQRWQAASSEQVAEAETTTTSVLEYATPQNLEPAVDPGLVPVAPAVPLPPAAPAKAAPKTSSTVPAVRKPEPSYEPVPSPVPPTVITPQLAQASPEVQAKPAAPPPVMFGGVKLMRVDGSRVKEVDAFLQFADGEVRVLDGRVRTSLARVPFSAISHVTYSSGKRPAWRKDIGPVPTESAFDTTVRTFHYLAFQGPSQFLLVRVKDDDLARLRDELRSRANLGVETVR